VIRMLLCWIQTNCRCKKLYYIVFSYKVLQIFSHNLEKRFYMISAICGLWLCFCIVTKICNYYQIVWLKINFVIITIWKGRLHSLSLWTYFKIMATVMDCFYCWRWCRGSSRTLLFLVYFSAICCLWNEQIIRKNLKISTLESKLRNRRIRWNGHLLRLNEEIPEEDFEHEGKKGKCPRSWQIKSATTD
jgi:hypothetical protein